MRKLGSDLAARISVARVGIRFESGNLDVWEIYHVVFGSRSGIAIKLLERFQRGTLPSLEALAWSRPTGQHPEGHQLLAEGERNENPDGYGSSCCALSLGFLAAKDFEQARACARESLKSTLIAAGCVVIAEQELEAWSRR